MSPAFQQKGYWCGIASIQAALQALQVRATQPAIAARCHVNPVDGTSEEEMKRALLAYGVGLDEFETNLEKKAHSWLLEHVDMYGPAIVCVDEWEHWVVVIGRTADMFIVFDPAKTPENKKKLGIHFYSWIGLRTRWLLPRRAGGKSFYGIGVSQ